MTEFVGSLPAKTPTFSGDAVGDVLICTYKKLRQAVLIRLFQVIGPGHLQNLQNLLASRFTWWPRWLLRYCAGDNHLNILEPRIRVRIYSHQCVTGTECRLYPLYAVIPPAPLEPPFRCKVGYCNTSEL